MLGCAFTAFQGMRGIVCPAQNLVLLRNDKSDAANFFDGIMRTSNLSHGKLNLIHLNSIIYWCHPLPDWLQTKAGCRRQLLAFVSCGGSVHQWCDAECVTSIHVFSSRNEFGHKRVLDPSRQQCEGLRHPIRQSTFCQGSRAPEKRKLESLTGRTQSCDDGHL
jgi:hypothetical protein